MRSDLIVSWRPRTSVWLASVDWKQLAADLSMVATVVAVLCVFGLSAVTLEHFGISYLTSSGSMVSKVHPATFAAVAALLLRCLASDQPIRAGWSLCSHDPNIVILATAVAIAGAYAILIAKSPVTPLIDSFLLPVFFYILLRDLHPSMRKWIALLLIAFFCINAGTGIYEFLSNTHVVKLHLVEGASSDPTKADAVFDWRTELMLDWRATAFLGHPLNNGLIVGGLILCLLAPGCRWIPDRIRLPLILLQIASMFAFGVRVPLVLTIVLGSALVLSQFREAWHRGTRVSSRELGFVLLAIVLVAGIGFGLYESGFFDRTLARFNADAGSARAREVMFDLLSPLSWSEIFLGPSPEVVATWQRLYGLEFGIESSWIGLLLTYGLIVTAAVMAGLLAFWHSLWKASGRGAFVVLVYYFIFISGTTGLSGKSTTLAMITVLLLVFLYRDERRSSLRYTLSVKYGVLR